MMIVERKCRDCGITDIPSGLDTIQIDGEVLCRADDDLCSRCQDLNQKALERDAARYRHLRNRQTRPADLATGGIFAGRVPEDVILGGEYLIAIGAIFAGRVPANVILGGENLDRAIDGEMGADVPATAPLEERLADCLAAAIDEPLLTGRDEVGGFSSPLDIRLGFFKPEISERAAELLEEARR